MTAPAPQTAMTLRGWTLFAVVSALWGVPYLFIAVALDQGIGPISVVAGRVALGALTLLPLACRPALARLLRRRWRHLSVLAAVEVTVPFILISVGEQTVSSALTGVLIATEPLFVVLLGRCFGGVERPGVVAWTGIGVGFLGVIALLGLQGAGVGVPLVLAAAACYGLGPLLVRRWFADVDSLVLAAALLLVAVPPLLAAAVSAESLPGLTATGVGAVAVLGIACTAGGFAAFFALIRAAGPVRASITAYVAPMVALLAGNLVLDEPITSRAVLGVMLILASAYCSAHRQHRPLTSKTHGGGTERAAAGSGRRRASH